MRAIRIAATTLYTLLLATVAGAQIGPGPFAAFPTADVTDARFLGFGCPGIETFEQGVSLRVAVPADQSELILSVFDGDTGKSSGPGPHWDVGSRQLVFSLYADPSRTANTDAGNFIGSWTGNDPNPTSGPLWTASAAEMPDNDWWAVTVDTTPLAAAPSGFFFYHLRIDLDGDCGVGEVLESNIKVAASNPLSFSTPRFALVSALRQFFTDGPIIYPGPFPPASFVTAPTTNDGTFEFFFEIPGGTFDLSLFDGDFDHGTSSLIGVPSGTLLDPCADLDDANTPADYSDFPFSTDGALPEGIRTPGAPADDTAGDIFRRGEPGSPGRVGCVRYEVIDPNGVVYRNDNPSGNLEWERFRIATVNAINPNDADYGPGVAADGVTFVDTPTLPGGEWTVRIVGLDLSNLNFWFAETCALRDGVSACPPPASFLVGDTVWFDSDKDGVQDAGEGGIAGVTVELVNDEGNVVATAITGDDSSPVWSACLENNTGLDEQGLYCFGIEQPAEYTVRIADSNFETGGALAGLISTTGGESQTDTVVDDNVLTYDFGYVTAGSIGDRVWLDSDGDSVQDGGEPGINGVTVRLFDGGGNEVASQVTSGDGNYLFTGLGPGDFTVVVDTTTLPPNLEPTYDLDGLATPHRASLTLGLGEQRLDVDFGYDQCGPCEGKVSRLVLRYDGPGTALVEVFAKRGPSVDPVFSGTVSPGGSFELTPPPGGNDGHAGTLGTEIRIFVNGTLHTKIHTSCSQPIGPGLVSGDFTVLAGDSKHGGPLCPLDGGGCPTCPTDECLPKLDFDRDPAGNSLPRGTIVEEQWASQGIHVTTGDPVNHPAMIFDSASPTGGDWDLGSPNNQCHPAGPGSGNGGNPGDPGENCSPQGKVLIITEDRDQSDPDDNAAGGTLIFTFDHPVRVDAVQLLDIEETGGTVKAYNAGGGLIVSVGIPALGNNSFQELTVGAAGVSRLEVRLKGSGAVPAIVFCADDEPPPPPPPSAPGTGTLGYWKNHPEAWPVEQIVIGGRTYTKAQAIAEMSAPVRGDKTRSMFQQLVAAKLNVLVGNASSCIADTIASADAWMTTFPLGSGVGSNDRAWKRYGAGYHSLLDDYNNGRLCAAHRD